MISHCMLFGIDRLSQLDCLSLVESFWQHLTYTFFAVAAILLVVEKCSKAPQEHCAYDSDMAGVLLAAVCANNNCLSFMRCCMRVLSCLKHLAPDMRNHDVGEMNAEPRHAKGVVTELKHAQDGTAKMLPQELWLYLTLLFPLEEGSNASRFEVFSKHESSATAGKDNAQPSSAATHTDNTDWVWLGTAATSQFRVAPLQLPFNLDKVHFAVRPADALGKLAPFDNAAYAVIQRP